MELLKKILRRRRQGPLPQPSTEVVWEDYLRRLQPDDRENVAEVCRRLSTLAAAEHLPLTVMAVGSVLNSREYYRDLDLLLLPLHKRDVVRAEEIFERFVTNQPEVVRDETHPERRVKEGKWWSLHLYDVCRYWSLQFPCGKYMDLFVYTDFRRMTLREKLEMEAEEALFFQRKFAYLTITPP